MNNEQELRDLFRAERAVEPPSLAVEHGLRRLTLDLSANVLPPSVAVGPLKLGLSVVPKWLLGGFTLGLIGAGAAGPLFTSSATPTPSTPAPSSAVTRPASPMALASSEREPEAAPAVAGQEGPGVPASVRATSVADSAPSASFDAELKLISFAKGELDEHRPERARAWLVEHAERFPHGVFVVEREALLALVDCVQQPESVTLAKRFAVQHPNSPLLERLVRVCGLSVASKFPNGSATPGERIIEPNGVQKR